MKPSEAGASDRPRPDREVLRAEDFSDDDLAAISAASVPDEYAYLDFELDDWSA